VRAFIGRSGSGVPKEVSRTVYGTKKDALRAAAGPTVSPVGRASGRVVADVLDAWVARSSPTWALASHRDQTSRVARIKADRIARVPLARLGVANVEKWHGLLRADDSAIETDRRLGSTVLADAPTKTANQRRLTPDATTLAVLERERGTTLTRMVTASPPTSGVPRSPRTQASERAGGLRLALRTLLSTVHWVIQTGGVAVDDGPSIAGAVRSWSERKNQLFTDHHVLVARARLIQTGWIDAPEIARAGIVG
jgi:hypothetical protein